MYLCNDLIKFKIITMLTEKECEVMNSFKKDTLMEALGMVFVPTDDDYVVVRMQISK